MLIFIARLIAPRTVAKFTAVHSDVISQTISAEVPVHEPRARVQLFQQRLVCLLFDKARHAESGFWNANLQFGSIFLLLNVL